MTTETDMPLILLPGIGTDARLFALQRMAFPQLVVPEWLPPRRRESLADYAARMAEAANPGKPCVVGGMSFGGMIALEMTRHLPALGCVLLASVKSRQELTPLLRGVGPLAYLLPQNSDRIVARMGGVLHRSLGRILPTRGRKICEHVSRTRSPLIPWAWQASLSWRSGGNWPCPVYHLHGESDPIFPARRTKPDRLVPGGGHLLPLTHPYVVNEFLRECLAHVSEVQG